ncbi:MULTISPECIES: hypothetical protein [Fictibacillus]|uniref:Uncharacterized protein n=1 Tax=Fictibacillus terranigra TaxID=3058424 RepID=A0ABT8EB91_9BACL|nr:hypothetical protein [Fictibacillus sp. CENA-BCM004]MDN4075183.1 hypothetical protein [Fictibacillus sp. CENA-BCM004]
MLTYDDYVYALLIWCSQLKKDVQTAADDCGEFRIREIIKAYEKRIATFTKGLYDLQELKTSGKIRAIESQALCLYKEWSRVQLLLKNSLS